MDNRDSTNVGAAFDILLESLDEEIQYINRLITESVARSEYEYIQALSSHASSIKDYQQEIEAMRDRWEQGFAQIPDVPQAVNQTVQRPRELAESRQKRRNFGRLSDGSHTPPAELMIPILEVLEEAGGHGRARELLHAVHRKVEATLSQFDYEGTTTRPDTPRWQNTAYYARQRLIREGLIKGDSPVGVWEITERGRKELQRFQRERTDVEPVMEQQTVSTFDTPDVHGTSESYMSVAEARSSRGKFERTRIGRGESTPREAFRYPIMKILRDLGGSGSVRAVLEQVEPLVRNELVPADYEIVGQHPEEPRWRNRVRWTRNDLVEEGLLKNNSPRGVWELSEAGYRKLQRQEQGEHGS